MVFYRNLRGEPEPEPELFDLQSKNHQNVIKWEAKYSDAEHEGRERETFFKK